MFSLARVGGKDPAAIKNGRKEKAFAIIYRIYKIIYKIFTERVQSVHAAET